MICARSCGRSGGFTSRTWGWPRTDRLAVFRLAGCVFLGATRVRVHRAANAAWQPRVKQFSRPFRCFPSSSRGCERASTTHSVVVLARSALASAAVRGACIGHNVPNLGARLPCREWFTLQGGMAEARGRQGGGRLGAEAK